MNVLIANKTSMISFCKMIQTHEAITNGSSFLIRTKTANVCVSTLLTLSRSISSFKMELGLLELVLKIRPKVGIVLAGILTIKRAMSVGKSLITRLYINITTLFPLL